MRRYPADGGAKGNEGPTQAYNNAGGRRRQWAKARGLSSQGPRLSNHPSRRR
jgi:hypothetical protein